MQVLAVHRAAMTAAAAVHQGSAVLASHQGLRQTPAAERYIREVNVSIAFAPSDPQHELMSQR